MVLEQRFSIAPTEHMLNRNCDENGKKMEMVEVCDDSMNIQEGVPHERHETKQHQCDGHLPIRDGDGDGDGDGGGDGDGKGDATWSESLNSECTACISFSMRFCRKSGLHNMSAKRWRDGSR